MYQIQVSTKVTSYLEPTEGKTPVGGPVETGRQGEPTVIPDGAANTTLPSNADPTEAKKSQEPPDSSAHSEATFGSGSEMELESGSGFDDSAEGATSPDVVLHQSSQDQNFRLTDEGLFLQGEQL
ncbi:UNVERIFIED_CONTAM: hypothetical protein K2H54_026621 [Gekko kuhli]